MAEQSSNKEYYVDTWVHYLLTIYQQNNIASMSSRN